MNKGIIVVMAASALGLGIASVAISANNTANVYEQNIIAQHQQSENVLGQYAPKLAEQIGVTKLQANAVKDIFNSANTSRYGKDGSQANMQWITEQNPNFDQSNYHLVLETIEAGRNDFQNQQKTKIDQVREYRTALGQFPSGFVMKIMGWPSEDFFARYGEIVVSDHAAKAFETGRDNGLDISKM